MQKQLKVGAPIHFLRKDTAADTQVQPAAPAALKVKARGFTPPGIIAGSRQVGTGRAIEVAYYAVASSLDQDAVKFVYVERNGWVHFIGAAAKEFVNAPSGRITTELARALLPAKAGDGLAVISPSEYGRFAAIVRRGTDDALSVYTGSNEDAEEFVRDSGADLIRDASDDDTDLGALPEWVGYDLSQTYETRKTAMIIVVAMFVTTALMCATWVGSSYLAGTYSAKVENYRSLAEGAIRSAAVELGSADKQNATVVDEFKRLLTLAVEAKGKVVRFIATEGRVIGWSIEVPEYTPAPVYERLGVERAERREGKLILTKGIVQ